MKLINRMFAILTALTLLVFSPQLSFAAQTSLSAEGYNLRLNAETIELPFPDGSVLHTPKDVDLKTLDGVRATGGGMAQAMLDQAYAELGLTRSADLPKAFGLAQNYPNPFNPSTTITYNIPEGSDRVAVKLTVFNLRGQLVKSLVDDFKGPGQYSVNWDGSDSNGQRVASGVYFYRINAGDFRATRKMVILK